MPTEQDLFVTPLNAWTEDLFRHKLLVPPERIKCSDGENRNLWRCLSARLDELKQSRSSPLCKFSIWKKSSDGTVVPHL